MAEQGTNLLRQTEGGIRMGITGKMKAEAVDTENKFALSSLAEMTASGLEIVALLIKSNLTPNFIRCFSNTVHFFSQHFNRAILVLILERRTLGLSDETCPIL